MSNPLPFAPRTDVRIHPPTAHISLFAEDTAYGHYIAYVRAANIWYQMNDAQVHVSSPYCYPTPRPTQV